MKRKLENSSKNPKIGKSTPIQRKNIKRSKNITGKNPDKKTVSISSNIIEHTKVDGCTTEHIEEQFNLFCKMSGINVGLTVAGDTEIGRGMVASQDIKVGDVMCSLPSALTLSEYLVRRSIVGRCVEFVIHHPYFTDSHLPEHLDQLTQDYIEDSVLKSDLHTLDHSHTDNNIGDDGRPLLLPGQLSLYAFLIHHRFNGCAWNNQLINTHSLPSDSSETHNAHTDLLDPLEVVTSSLKDHTPVEGNPLLIDSCQTNSSHTNSTQTDTVHTISAQSESEAIKSIVNIGSFSSVEQLLKLHPKYSTQSPSSTSTSTSTSPTSLTSSQPSFWSHYCRWLPATYSDPLFWSLDERQRLLSGTNLSVAVSHRLQTLRRIYDHTFSRLFALFPSIFSPTTYTFERFIWAHCCYSSRSFPGNMVMCEIVNETLKRRNWKEVELSRTLRETVKNNMSTHKSGKGLDKDENLIDNQTLEIPSMSHLFQLITEDTVRSQPSVPDSFPSLGVMFPYLDLTNHKHRHPIHWLHGSPQSETVGRAINAYWGRDSLHSCNKSNTSGKDESENSNDYMTFINTDLPDGWLPTIIGPCESESPSTSTEVAQHSVRNISPTGSKLDWRVSYQSCHTYKTGEQIFNNYGPKSNEELLLGYGFVVDDNPDDHYSVQLSRSPNSKVATLMQHTRPHFTLGHEDPSHPVKHDGLVHYLRNHHASGPVPPSLMRVLRSCSLPKLLLSRVLATCRPTARPDPHPNTTLPLEDVCMGLWQTPPDLLLSNDPLVPLNTWTEIRTLTSLQDMLVAKLTLLTKTTLNDVLGPTLYQAFVQDEDKINACDLDEDGSDSEDGDGDLEEMLGQWITNQKTVLHRERKTARWCLEKGEFHLYCALTYRAGQRSLLLKAYQQCVTHLLYVFNHKESQPKEELLAVMDNMGDNDMADMDDNENSTTTEDDQDEDGQGDECVLLAAGYIEWRNWLMKVGGECNFAFTYDGQSYPVYGQLSAEGTVCVDPNSRLLVVPRKVFLSVSSMASSSTFKHVYSQLKQKRVDDTVALALYVLHEWSKGKRSKWHPYFHALTHPNNTGNTLKLSDSNVFNGMSESESEGESESGSVGERHMNMMGVFDVGIGSNEEVCALLQLNTPSNTPQYIFSSDATTPSHITITSNSTGSNSHSVSEEEGEEEVNADLNSTPALARVLNYKDYYLDLYDQLVAPLLTQDQSDSADEDSEASVHLDFSPAVYSSHNFSLAMHLVETFSIQIRDPLTKQTSLGVVPVPFRLTKTSYITNTTVTASATASVDPENNYLVQQFKQTLSVDSTTPLLAVTMSEQGMEGSGLYLSPNPLSVWLESPILSFATDQSAPIPRPRKTHSVSPDLSSSVLNSLHLSPTDPHILDSPEARLAEWGLLVSDYQKQRQAGIFKMGVSIVNEEVELESGYANTVDDDVLRFGHSFVIDLPSNCTININTNSNSPLTFPFATNPYEVIPINRKYLCRALTSISSDLLPPSLQQALGGYSTETVIAAINNASAASTVYVPSEGGRNIGVRVEEDSASSPSVTFTTSVTANDHIVTLLPIDIIALLVQIERVILSLIANDVDEQDNVLLHSNSLVNTLYTDYSTSTSEPYTNLTKLWCIESLKWSSFFKYVLNLRTQQHMTQIETLCETYPSLTNTNSEEVELYPNYVYSILNYHLQQIVAISQWLKQSL